MERQLVIPESGVKRKLLEAAELLCGEKGFKAVSVRDITQLAKTNVAAVNYHFGSRDHLLTLVMMRHMTPVTQERLARLDLVERKGAANPPPLEDIIDALVRPLAGVAEKSELADGLFYKLVGQICAAREIDLSPQIEDQFRQTAERFGRAFAKALPSIPPEELAGRIHFVMGGMSYVLTHGAILDRVSGGAAGSPPLELTLSRFIRFAAAGLREGALEEVVAVEEGSQATFDF